MFLSDRAWRWGDYGYGNPWTGEFSAEQLATLTSKTTQTHTVTSVNTATVVKTVTAGGRSGAATPTQTHTITRTDASTAHSASPSKVPLSLAGATISLAVSGSHSATSAADNATTNASGSTISISITVSGSNPTVTFRGSGSTLQPIATGASSSTSPSGSQGMGKGEVAAITLAILFVVGLSGMLCYAWRRRKATQRSASPITQYVFSTGTATATMASAAPQPRPTLPPISAECDAHADPDVAAESTAAATFQSPMGASGYDGGRAVYPLDDKSRDALFYPARTPSPRSSTAFALSFPMPPQTRPTTTTTPASPTPIVSPPAIHTQQPSAGPEHSTLPYSWDHPPPSSEYLPRTSVRQSMSRFLVESRLPPGEGGRGSYGTVASTPAYSSGVPEGAGTRPPSYSRY